MGGQGKEMNKASATDYDGELGGANETADKDARQSRRRFGLGQKGSPPKIEQTLPPLSQQGLIIGTRTAQRNAQHREPGAAKKSSSTPFLTQRHDPARIQVRRPDGRVNVKGVRDVSDVSLYSQHDPYAKNTFDVRTA